MNDQMITGIRIAIVADLEAGQPSRRATDEALSHGADALRLLVRAEWIPTQTLQTDAGSIKLEQYDGVFSPGGLYKSMNGALEAIRFARQRGRPFLAT